MNSILIKLSLVFVVISLNGCHTFEHENPFVENNKVFLNEQFPNLENKNTQISQKNNNNKKLLNKTEMAPIKHLLEKIKF